MKKKTRLRGLLPLIAILTCLGSTSALAERIDVLVVYTDHANMRDPAATISNMVGFANRSYANSNVDIELRLVHMEEVNFRGDSRIDDASLEALTENEDIAELRDEHGADFVVLITGEGSSGKGWLAEGNARTGQLDAGSDEYAFCVLGPEGASTFAHELGHNMGLGHGLANDGNRNGGVWSWARGHGVRNSFGTIMTYYWDYGRDAVEVPYFSNPEVEECDDQACGVDHNSRSGADSARNLNLLAAQLAAFRAEVHDDDDGDETADGEAPSVPTNLRLDRSGETSIAFTWRASNDNVAVTGYDVLRDGGLIATVAETRYSDQGLAPDTAYSYTVVAKDAAGNASAASATLDARTLPLPPPADTEAPSVPEGLRASAIEQTSIALAWLAASDNVDVTGYQVRRDGVTIGTTDRFDYRDAGLTPETTYRYTVRAMDAAGNVSDSSESLYVTTKPEDTTVTPPSGNLLTNGDFGQGVSGWKTRDSRIGVRTNASGNPWLLVRDRDDWDSGVTRNVRGIMQPGKTYTVSADFRLLGNGTDEDYVAIYLYVEERGRQGEWILVADDWATKKWGNLSGSVDIDPSADVRRAFLAFFGPDPWVRFGLDNVILEEITD